MGGVGVEVEVGVGVEVEVGVGVEVEGGGRGVAWVVGTELGRRVPASAGTGLHGLQARASL